MRLRKSSYHVGGVERLLWLVALAAFSVGGFFALQSLLAQRQAEVRFSGPESSAAKRSATRLERASPAIEGMVEIARLNLSVPIFSDCSDQSLRKGSCHVPGTAVAGGLGNMGVAGHRDGTFRPLRGIRLGDEVVVHAADGSFRYRVASTTVVAADDVSVLAIGDEPELTLITCFPFHYVGTAPKRFIVHARLLSADGGN